MTKELKFYYDNGWKFQELGGRIYPIDSDDGIKFVQELVEGDQDLEDDLERSEKENDILSKEIIRLENKLDETQSELDELNDEIENMRIEK